MDTWYWSIETAAEKHSRLLEVLSRPLDHNPTTVSIYHINSSFVDNISFPYQFATSWLMYFVFFTVLIVLLIIDTNNAIINNTIISIKLIP